MRDYRKIVLPVLVVLAAIAVATMAARPNKGTSSSLSLGQDESNKSRDRRKWDLIPIDVAPEETDPQKHALRRNKNQRYKYEHGEPLMNQPDGQIYGRVDEASPPPPIPASASNVIIVGTVTKAQPYLDELERSIYSELTVHIEEVIKNDTPLSLAPNTSIVADRVGGALRLPNGRVLRYVVSGAGALPTSGGRHVLFLKRIHQEQDLSILAGYELSGGLISPLEDTPDREPYVGTKETDFLNMGKAAVADAVRSQLDKGDTRQ